MATLLSIIIAALIHQIETEPDNCTNLNNKIQKTILQQEASTLKCFDDELLKVKNNDPLVFQCYKNGFEIITTDQGQRVHLKGISLWFLPALVTDSGNYACYLRNKTFCIKEIIQIRVLELPPNQCFHHDCLQPTLEEPPASVYVYCTGLAEFSQKPFDLQWYKDCNPIKIDDQNYYSLSEKLLIKDASQEDDGMYTCELEFVYLGRKYKVTKTTELKISPVKVIYPDLISPKNNTIEARLGSELEVTCEAYLGSGRLQFTKLFWRVNTMKIPTDESRIKQGHIFRKEGTGHEVVVMRTLFISKITEEDFQTKFDCFASNLQGKRGAFVKISRQSADWISDAIKILIPLIFGFLACATVYVIFKVDIVLWYRDSFESHKVINDGKKFDAYVIYPRSASKGQKENYKAKYFAVHILPKVLEEKYGYKLFIYGRDDLPGQAATEVIENNIRSSRRLIIILTQMTSADDQAYSGFERQIGLYKALIENEIKVILIEFEKFECLSGFPESIRHLIQRNGTVKWKSDETNKLDAVCSRFWKQVRYKMPARKKTLAGSV
ncbi:interleukin-1 receptor type 1-like [Hemitrygon akajei]|uniref:interleukin-1 receptor type 1-like n=1 Tax=Hemitrygon akajei TaxID=2704970 RepID=UPI003BF9EC34